MGESIIKTRKYTLPVKKISITFLYFKISAKKTEQTVLKGFYWCVALISGLTIQIKVNNQLGGAHNPFYTKASIGTRHSNFLKVYQKHFFTNVKFPLPHHRNGFH